MRYLDSIINHLASLRITDIASLFVAFLALVIAARQLTLMNRQLEIDEQQNKIILENLAKKAVLNPRLKLFRFNEVTHGMEFEFTVSNSGNKTATTFLWEVAVDAPPAATTVSTATGPAETILSEPITFGGRPPFRLFQRWVDNPLYPGHSTNVAVLRVTTGQIQGTFQLRYRLTWEDGNNPASGEYGIANFDLDQLIPPLRREYP